jgi:hypothetical protein
MRKFISFIIFLIIFNLVFPKISLAGGWIWRPTCRYSVSYVPASEVPSALQSYLSSYGPGSSIVFRDYGNLNGGYGDMDKFFGDGKVFTLHAVPPQPPYYDEAYRPAYSFKGAVASTTIGETKSELLRLFTETPQLDILIRKWSELELMLMS